MADFYSLPPEKQQEILNGPAVPPPDGVEPNFTNPQSQNTAPRVVLGFCLAVNTILVALRIYGRWIVLKKATIADYLIVPTYILFVAFVAILFVLVENYGYFIHTWDFQAKAIPPIIYNFLNSISLYAATLALIKVAILLEWLNIFTSKGSRNYFFWCAHILLWVNALFYFSAIVVINVSCMPREKYWNRLLPGKCIDDIPIDIASAVVNFTVDVGILLLPQRVIWRLNMSRRNRIGVSGIFGLGVLAVATAGYRTVFTIQKRHSVDTTWDYSLISILLAVEITCGFVVVCLPSCPKALHAMGAFSLYSKIKSTFTTRYSSRSEGSNSERFGSNGSWPRIRNKASHSSGQQDTPKGDFVSLEQYGSHTGLNKHSFSISEDHRAVV
ncbi:hypothetical protein F5Y07DRAFT_374852 [Xylaria sp. FL0933]|nr:hypothetical protein F5Y07DRAFT_374852 [Xylaria sp. FL0933]